MKDDTTNRFRLRFLPLINWFKI